MDPKERAAILIILALQDAERNLRAYTDAVLFRARKTALEELACLFALRPRDVLEFLGSGGGLVQMGAAHDLAQAMQAIEAVTSSMVLAPHRRKAQRFWINHEMIGAYLLAIDCIGNEHYKDLHIECRLAVRLLHRILHWVYNFDAFGAFEGSSFINDTETDDVVDIVGPIHREVHQEFKRVNSLYGAFKPLQEFVAAFGIGDSGMMRGHPHQAPPGPVPEWTFYTRHENHGFVPKYPELLALAWTHAAHKAIDGLWPLIDEDLSKVKEVPQDVLNEYLEIVKADKAE